MDGQEDSFDISRLFAMSLDMLCVANTEGYFLEVNQAFTETLGWSREELLSRQFLDFVHPDDIDDTLAEVEKLAAGVPTIRFFNRYRTVGGEFRWLAWTGRPDPEAGLLYAVARDVTSEKALERDLVEAREAAEMGSEAKSRFLANMSHELRTPLNAIVGYSEMLEEDAVALEQEQMAVDLRRIQSAGRQLLGLISQLLDLSKIEAGHMEAQLEAVDLGELIENVMGTIQPLIAQGGNRFELDAPPGMHIVKTDGQRLRQILLNLLSNACKFTQQGLIGMSVKLDVGRLRIEVFDSGIGMTEEQLGRVFNPFVQADPSTTRRYGGTGLGLALCARFAGLMGGSLRAESEPDVGTRFYLELPVELPSQAPRAVGPPRLPAGPHVVCVDDDADALELLKRILQRHDYRVTTLAQSTSAVDAIRAIQPDVVILDVLMPGPSGWDVLEALKAAPETSDIPVLMVSMSDPPGSARALGLAGFMSKPVDRDTLLSEIARLAKGSPPRVLVVEDDPDIRELVVRTIGRAGWTAVPAANGREALKLFTERAPNVVLLDLMMPEMDGFEFVEHMKALPAGGAVPVVVLTALTLTAKDRARLGGKIHHIFTKGSVTSGGLIEALRTLLETP